MQLSNGKLVLNLSIFVLMFSATRRGALTSVKVFVSLKTVLHIVLISSSTFSASIAVNEPDFKKLYVPTLLCIINAVNPEFTKVDTNTSGLEEVFAILASLILMDSRCILDTAFSSCTYLRVIQLNIKYQLYEILPFNEWTMDFINSVQILLTRNT